MEEVGSMPIAVKDWPSAGEKSEYKCTLDEMYKKIALEELREDDNIRKQALDQFRENIVKSATIRKCRMDSVFLLRFLRTKKFNVQSSVENLEKYLQIRQLFPSWFQNLDPLDPEVDDLISSGYLVPLPKRDEKGRRIILRRARMFDSTKCKPSTLIRTHAIIAESLMDQEESQISGYIYVNDESEFPIAQMTMFTLSELKNLIRGVQNSSPMRHKETHFCNIPKFAYQILDFVMMLLADKHQKRILFHSTMEEMGKKIDLSLLPKEYGGETPIDEIIADFKKVLVKKRPYLLGLDEGYIEISKSVKNSFENTDNNLVGSFRKLEVD